MERVLVYHDELTGLGGGAACMDYLDTCVKNSLTQFGIIFLDINNLKCVDDNWGHDMGDALIKETARVINGSFSKFGKAYRVGWGKFCVLIDSKTPDSDYNVAKEQFEKLIETSNADKPNHLKIHVSYNFRICQ